MSMIDILDKNFKKGDRVIERDSQLCGTVIEVHDRDGRTHVVMRADNGSLRGHNIWHYEKLPCAQSRAQHQTLVTQPKSTEQKFKVGVRAVCIGGIHGLITESESDLITMMIDGSRFTMTESPHNFILE